MHLPAISSAGALLIALIFATEAPPAGATRATQAPALLSETGFFADLKRHVVADDFTAYSVNVGAWADGASKLRFIRIPEGKTAAYRERGSWAFPDGTVLMQTIVMPMGSLRRRVETRIIDIVDGKPTFRTYVWRADQSDADLRTRGAEIDLEWDEGFVLWKVTPTGKCKQCHEHEAQPLLGMTTEQLNVDDQIQRWSRAGLLSGMPGNTADLPRLLDPTDNALPLEKRARSYLAANCSPCHQPGGNGSGLLDLRWATPPAETGLAKKNDVLIKGRPSLSWIYLRLVYDGRRKMPGVLTSHEDEKGAQLLWNWIKSLDQTGGER